MVRRSRDFTNRMSWRLARRPWYPLASLRYRISARAGKDVTDRACWSHTLAIQVFDHRYRSAIGTRAIRSGCVGRVPGGAPQGRLRQQHHKLPLRPHHHHHLARRSLDTRRLFRGPAGPGASAGGSGAPGRRSPVLCRRSHLTGILLHLSRRIPDRSARHVRDRCRVARAVERARRGQVTTNHAMPTNVPEFGAPRHTVRSLDCGA